MNMKRILALALTGAMTFSLAACGPKEKPDASGSKSPAQSTPAPSGATQIELWTYPVGNWKDQATVNKLTEQFKADTGIDVKVEYLAYGDGDDQVNTAITGKNTPDLILEGPERLVANWGANGYMVDLSDMLDDTDKSEILPSALKACTTEDGKVYEYPLVMTAHCMGINLTAFKEAGADQYLDLENHTWTTENYFKAIEALNAKFGDNITAVYCAGQGGDQGTRALVDNLYGGTFTNENFTEYTWDNEQNVKALEQLKNTKGVNFDASLQGGDEIKNFYQGNLKIANCWNIQQQLNPNGANTGAGKTVTGDEIIPMAFPSEDGTPVLEGGIWGFGIFDNGDPAKIEAAKTFIKYMCDSEHTVDAVKTATFFPARTAAEGTDLTNVWADDAVMQDYQILMPYLGQYFQVAQGWPASRTAWWNALQAIGQGKDVAETLQAGCAEANAAMAK